MAPPARADLLIRHAYLVTLDDAGTIVPDGALAVVGRRIAWLGTDAAAGAAGIAATRTIDARGGPVHPGFVESHTHVSFQTIRGIHAADAVEDDLLDDIYLPWFNLLTSQDEELATLLACLEMVRNGTTCFLEAGTVFDTEAAARAARTVGIRAVLGAPFIWDQPDGMAQGKVSPVEQARGPRPRVERAPRSFAEAVERMGDELWRNADPDALVRGHIAINGLGTGSEALLAEARRQADAAGVVMNLHHAYSVADTDADRLRYGRDPLVHLREAGILDTRTTLAHATHLTDAEIDAVVASGATLVWAPAASMHWGHGGMIRGRHADVWRRGGNVALGSDSANWSNDFDLFRQLDLALLTTRDVRGERAVLGAEDGLRMAARGGARAAGLEAEIGSLEAGKRADLVIHTLDRPELRPVTDMVRNLVHASRSKSVRTVVVDGRVVLDDGRFPDLDEPALLARIEANAQDMLTRMGLRPQRDPVRTRTEARSV